jgi:hypothetical protein
MASIIVGMIPGHAASGGAWNRTSRGRRAQSAAALTVALSLGGCSVLVDVEGYTFTSDAGAGASTPDGTGGSVSIDGVMNGGAAGSSMVAGDGTVPTNDCAADTRQCSEEGLPQTCGANRRWVTEAACGGDTPVCLGGRCAACAPGADPSTPAPRGCLGDTPRWCNSEGSWVLEEPCAGDTPRCLDETGQCVECVAAADCAWSECTDHRCTKALLVRGGSSGTRCVVLDDGRLACSGSNDLCGTDLLGGGNPDAPGEIGRLELVRGPGGESVLEDVRDVALGQCSFCASRASGDVLCWGVDSQGSLGNGTATGTGAVRVPALVVDIGGSGTLGGVLGLRGRSDSYCARLSTLDAVCWGGNPNGTLGNGSSVATGIPTYVSGVGGGGRLEPLDDIKADFSSCAVSSGQVYCSGSNQYGILAAASTTPVAIPGVDGSGQLGGVRTIETGSVSCGLLDSEQVACWGDNGTGALGRGPAGPSGSGSAAWTSTPGLVLDESGAQPLGSVVQIASAGAHVCALTRAGEVLCWGANALGQLGQNTISPESVDLPRKVLGVGGEGILGNVISIGGGLGFTCAVRSSGDVVCWGLRIERFEPEYAVESSAAAQVLERPVGL